MRKLFFRAASKRPFSFQKWVRQAKKPTKVSLICKKQSRVPGSGRKKMGFWVKFGLFPRKENFNAECRCFLFNRSSSEFPPLSKLQTNSNFPPPQILGNAKVAADFGLRVIRRGQIGCWKRYSTCTGFPMTGLS
jgi:hypothetical protein